MKNLSLNAKIGAIIGVLTLGSAGVAYLGLAKMTYINEKLTNITEVEMKRDELASNILDAQRVNTILNKEIIIETSPIKVAALDQERLKNRERFRQFIDEYRAIATPESKALLEKFEDTVKRLSALNAEIRELAKANNAEEASKLTSEKENPLRAESTRYIDEMNKLTAASLQRSSTEAHEAYQEARQLVVLITLLSLAIGVILSIIIMRAVSKSVNDVIHSLNDNSSQVTTAAHQIAASSEELSQSSTEQAASLEQTASAIEELNSMVQRNSEGAKKSVDIANSSSDTAERGKRVVEEMTSAMNAINTANVEIMAQITESNQKISEIAKVINEIGGKTKVINDIVFQTKLLSFNASVEAARAGEQGKGFAVVAEEVGNLAQMSGNAAKEISQMLEGSIQRVDSIVSETKTKVETLIAKGKAKVDIGTAVANQCRQVLNEIVGGVSTVSNTVRDIATASEEQARGVSEISKAMTQLDQGTQQNAAVSEEAASAAEELSAQAESLRRVVQVLIVTIKGGETKEPMAHSALHSEGSESRHSSKKSGQVITLPTNRVKASQARPRHVKLSVKRAVGSDSVPSEGDPRFEEV